MTLILRINFNGIDNREAVMNHCEKKLKCRVNEEEGLIVDEDAGRSGRV